MVQIVSSRVDHLANAAFGAVALVIVVVTLRLLGISPPGVATDTAKAADTPGAASQTQREGGPAAVGKARDDTFVQAAPGRLGVSWHVHAVVNRPAPPPPRVAP